jgi:hypothetical protein
LIAVGLVILLATPAQSQFVKTLGGSDYDAGGYMIQASDGGLVVTGHTLSFGAGTYYNGTLSKFDIFGNHLWTKMCDFGVQDLGGCLVQASDGGFFMSGYVFYGGYPDYHDPSIAKFDSLGNHLWSKTVQGSTYWEGYGSLIQASDGGLVVTGYTNTFGVGGYGKYDLILAKFDSSGSFLWARTLGGPGHEWGSQVIEAYDGGLVVAGAINSYGAGGWDLLLSKFDASGNYLWSRTLGGANYDWGRSVVQTSDSGFVVAGYTFSFAGGDSCLLLAKFDVSGNLLWTRTLGRMSARISESVMVMGGTTAIIKSSDEGFVVTGTTSNFGAGDYDVLLAKFNSSGDFLWARTLGGTGYDECPSLIRASDGGFVAAGFTDSYGAGSVDILLAKFDPSGNTCLGEFVTPPVQSVSPTVTSPTPTITSPTLIITSRTPTVTSPTPTITVVCDARLPKILFITDVGNDQGKQVRVKWSSSCFDDAGFADTITQYSIWRRAESGKFNGWDPEYLSSHDIKVVETIDEMLAQVLQAKPGDRFLVVDDKGSSGIVWVFITTVPAMQFEQYAYDAPTECDSTISGICWSVFFIAAHTQNPTVHYDSDPDSGYSLDNIPPLPIRDLAVYPNSWVTLQWTVPGEYVGEHPISTYDIRYNTVPVGQDTQAWWDSATACTTGEGFFNFIVGETDSLKVVKDCGCHPVVYFAIKGLDSRPNASGISNIVQFKCGDVDGDGGLNAADVVYLINYLFIDGPPPVPMAVGDINCDGAINAADVVYLINYLFIHGPKPCSP